LYAAVARCIAAAAAAAELALVLFCVQLQVDGHHIRVDRAAVAASTASALAAAAAAAAELALFLPCLLPLQVEGHHIRVDRAAPPAAAADGAAGGGGGSAGVQYDPTRSVFVGNLDFKVRGAVAIGFIRGLNGLFVIQVRAGVQYDPTRSLFVGNLDFKVRESGLTKLLLTQHHYLICCCDQFCCVSHAATSLVLQPGLQGVGFRCQQVDLQSALILDLVCSPTRSVLVGNLDFKVRRLHFGSQQVDVPVQSVALVT
jgi:hypothetical protein